MKKFPGKVGYVKVGYTRKLVLNDEQARWLRTWFPLTENCRLARAMGVSRFKLHDFARKMGLKKSESGLAAIRKRRDIKAAKSNERNGCYDRKRGHPVSEATMAGCRKRWQEEREGLRENAIIRMRRENPEKYQKLMQKRSELRRECFRKERLRLMYGLERKTALKMVMCPYKKSQSSHRCNALKRGYILTEDSSEGNPDRYVIYFDNQTVRSERFEQNCISDGFSIREWIY